MSAISSRKIVPPCASSNLPRRSATAPVNAPATWPNSSLSISSSGIAAQLTSTNGRRRAAQPWMLRATSSLPVPFSPKMSTRPLVGAAMATCSRSVHQRALPDHRVARVDAGPQRLVLGLEMTLPQRVAHDQHRLLERQRLLDEVERAHLDRAHRRFDIAVAGK
jgi:hypothetical protein